MHTYTYTHANTHAHTYARALVRSRAQATLVCALLPMRIHTAASGRGKPRVRYVVCLLRGMHIAIIACCRETVLLACPLQRGDCSTGHVIQRLDLRLQSLRLVLHTSAGTGRVLMPVRSHRSRCVQSCAQEIGVPPEYDHARCPCFSPVSRQLLS
jgi:hypothetical protein